MLDLSSSEVPSQLRLKDPWNFSTAGQRKFSRAETYVLHVEILVAPFSVKRDDTTFVPSSIGPRTITVRHPVSFTKLRQCYESFMQRPADCSPEVQSRPPGQKFVTDLQYAPASHDRFSARFKHLRRSKYRNLLPVYKYLMANPLIRLPVTFAYKLCCNESNIFISTRVARNGSTMFHY